MNQPSLDQSTSWQKSRFRSLNKAFLTFHCCIWLNENVIFVLLQLTSVNSEERECGCGTIASLVSQKSVIPQLLKLHVVKKMGPLMIDASQNVRCSAVGSFRLVQAEKMFFCLTYCTTTLHLMFLSTQLCTSQCYGKQVQSVRFFFPQKFKR